MKKVLVLTEHPTACVSETLLGRENLVSILVHDEKCALQRIRSSNPDVLIIDLPFAAIPSIELFVRLHLPNIDQSLIVVADSGDELNKVLALEVGGDDYLVKPYAPRELGARIRALLRRRKGPEKLIRFGHVEVDLALRIILFRGAEVSVTPSEYRLLSFFLNNANRVLCSKDMLRAVWGRLEDSQSRTCKKASQEVRGRPRRSETFSDSSSRRMPIPVLVIAILAFPAALPEPKRMIPGFEQPTVWPRDESECIAAAKRGYLRTFATSARMAFDVTNRWPPSSSTCRSFLA